MGCFGKKDDEAGKAIVLEDADPTPFAFPASQLAALFDPKSTDLLVEMGGGAGVCAGLLVDPATGLDPDAASLSAPSRVSIDPGLMNGADGHMKVRWK